VDLASASYDDLVGIRISVSRLVEEGRPTPICVLDSERGSIVGLLLLPSVGAAVGSDLIMKNATTQELRLTRTDSRPRSNRG